jgi:cysteine-rich repeat protein
MHRARGPATGITTRPIARARRGGLARVLLGGAVAGLTGIIGGCLFQSPALAHDARIEVATTKMRLKLGKAGKGVFVFVGTAPGLRPNPKEHPALAGVTLLVSGRGAESTGRSALIELDPLLWTSGGGIGRTWYTYSDKRGSRGGIRKVVLARDRIVVHGGRLPWMGAAAFDSVAVLLRLGDEWYCADASGAMRPRKGFFARDAAAPAGCPEETCGNGVHELGEQCDDGNLGNEDGCSPVCRLASCDGRPGFAGTWDALQWVFQQRGCTAAACHGGPAGQGALDLSTNVAYDNLFEVPSSGSAYMRVAPGAPRRSSLYLKLAKGRDPDGVDIAGAAMPSGLPPLDADILEALRMWIYAGAPQTGTVEGTERLLDACLPEPQPITITPLPPPAPDEGVQFEMPPFPLSASSETEVCFASYYDFTDLVPARFKDPTGQFFYVNGDELRQDPQSHHLQLLYPGVPEARVHDPAFGAWTCKGGDRHGKPCEPLDLASCGSGLCGSEPQQSVACIGFGPRENAIRIFGRMIGGSQTAQAYNPGRPGFYGLIPLKGVLYWNSHAFNLTGYDHVMHARLNKHFTEDLRFQQLGFNDLSTIYLAAGTPPFTERTVCASWTVPQGARLLWLSSHTHRHGRHFWVDTADDTRLYESFTYEDPVTANFDPPLAFDSPSPESRTLEYCARFNNGVAADGSPDAETVRRSSTTPPNGTACQPTACVAGRLGAPCAGVGDNATCDSTPGAGDGSCDACAMTEGVSTEDTMFLLFAGYVLGDTTE